MNLAMMRDINAGDPVGGLGPRVTPAPTPAPAPVKRPDGIVVGSDGKLSTDLPLPPGMAPAPWPFPTGTAAPVPEPEPGAHGFMREPPAGAMWRSLVAPCFYRWTQDGAEMWMDDGRGWEKTGPHWERHEFDGPAFARVEGANHDPA